MTAAIVLTALGGILAFTGFGFTNRRPDEYLDKPKESPFIEAVRPSGIAGT